jgi:hypothetical protein
MGTPVAGITTFFVACMLFGPALFTVSAKDPVIQGPNESDITAPAEPLRSGVTEKQLFAELAAHNESRSAELLEYTVKRTYQVSDLRGKVHAEEVGRMEYRAPDKKTFVVTSEAGSGLIRHLALNPLIASEIGAAAGKEHRDSSISPDNYTLELVANNS